MSIEDQDVGSVVPEGLSRRGLLRTAAGLGVAGVAAGLLIETSGSTASASGQVVTTGEPMVAHVKDAGTGEVDLFVGTRLVQFRDPELARRIARAAG
ncbi:MAG TPA: hypothetical protein VH352_15560 [Pseudonocardiaceae bacterium]|jgi:hypothetical protein|nr:hypothetical protein [Pseudonocardiaceae bacterium]